MAKTMYFWVGSEQGRHQDPFCLSGRIPAWIALQDVDVGNGMTLAQPFRIGSGCLSETILWRARSLWMGLQRGD